MRKISRAKKNIKLIILYNFALRTFTGLEKHTFV